MIYILCFGLSVILITAVAMYEYWVWSKNYIDDGYDDNIFVVK